MKRICLSLLITLFIFTFGFIPNINNTVYAAPTTPEYDATFNNNMGALFANGTPITISEDAGNTTVTWTGGSAQVTSSTLIFGGGKPGTSFESSNITMEGGTVGSIYGGGFSTNPDESASVNTANITINDGTVNGSILGGGLLYSEVNNSNIVMNNGTATFIVGGGIASFTYDGVRYNTGTEINPQNSGTIVDSVKITVNGGFVDDVYGGGQGYSNTKATSIEINNGVFDYVTAGGSNGYTGSADIKINGGNINVYQSTNRGTVDNTKFRMNNGNIETVYIGGQDAYDVTGVLNSSSFEILGGHVTDLYAGLSGGVPLEVDGKNYKLVYSDNVIENNHIPDVPATDIDFIFDIFMVIIGVLVIAGALFIVLFLLA